MSEPVTLGRDGNVGIITINNPPVNALSQPVRAGLMSAIITAARDEGIAALVIYCEGRTFIAGADIREFGKPPRPPALTEVIDAVENCPKPVVAAIHGTALGGGFELALGCHYRVAVATARVGLPEVKLGLLPGAGGTQRLPRLIGPEAALEMIVSGNPVPAGKAAARGILDEIVDGDLRSRAIAFARKLITENRPPRKVSALPVPVGNPNLFAEFEQSIARKQRGFLAPFHCIKAVKIACELPFAEGCRREGQLFLELMNSPQSAAQRHVFFAEREVAKIPGLPEDQPTRRDQIRRYHRRGNDGGRHYDGLCQCGPPCDLVGDEPGEPGARPCHDSLTIMLDSVAKTASRKRTWTSASPSSGRLFPTRICARRI